MLYAYVCRFFRKAIQTAFFGVDVDIKEKVMKVYVTAGNHVISSPYTQSRDHNVCHVISIITAPYFPRGLLKETPKGGWLITGLRTMTPGNIEVAH